MNMLAPALTAIFAFMSAPSETTKELFDLASGLETTQTEWKQS